jgi:hypothetical protein
MKTASISFRLFAFLMAGVFAATLLIADLLKVRYSAAAELGLPEPMRLLHLSKDYSCPVMRGLRIDPDDLLNLTFYVDGWDDETVSSEQASDLIGYFLAALTIPESDIWVNLSPYEDSHVLPESLGKTALGRGLLGQDYVLKQLASSLTHPDSETGRAYWSDVGARFTEARNQDLSPDKGYSQSLDKIWIVPDKAKVHEQGTTAVITEATLEMRCEDAAQKVLLPVTMRADILKAIFMNFWFARSR